MGVAMFFVAIVAVAWVLLTDKTSPIVQEREYKKAHTPEALKKAATEEQCALEAWQKKLSQVEGLKKYHMMDADEVEKRQQAIKAMRELGVMMQNSVYQEKEIDWAIMGGIADGIAGPAAGVAAAVDAMQQNAQIRADNEARRVWGAQQRLEFERLANKAEAKRTYALSMAQLEDTYTTDFSWSTKELFQRLSINKKSAEIDEKTGAVMVTVQWKTNYSSTCIDGSLRAILYTSAGICAGCAFLNFPKDGTKKRSGTLSGVCAMPTESDSYSVVISPINLWVLALKSNSHWNEHGKMSASDREAELRELQNTYDTEYQKGLAIHKEQMAFSETQQKRMRAEQDKIAAAKNKKIMKIVIPVSIVVLAGVITASVLLDVGRRYVAESEKIAEEYGLTDITVSWESDGVYDRYKLYKLIISSPSIAKMEDEKIRDLIKQVEWSDMHLKAYERGYLVFISAVSNGDEYTVDGWTLEKNGSRVY